MLVLDKEKQCAFQYFIHVQSIANSFKNIRDPDIFCLQRRHATAWFRWHWKCIRHLPWAHSPCRTSSTLTQAYSCYSCKGDHLPAKTWCYLFRSWVWLCKVSGNQLHHRGLVLKTAKLVIKLVTQLISVTDDLCFIGENWKLNVRFLFLNVNVRCLF